MQFKNVSETVPPTEEYFKNQCFVCVEIVKVVEVVKVVLCIQDTLRCPAGDMGQGGQPRFTSLGIAPRSN